MEKIIIYIDGASNSNPGKAGIGVLFVKNGKIYKEYSQEVGIRTNNEAEYLALIFALKKAKLLFGKKALEEYFFEIRSDSQLLVNQVNGKYKILDDKIQKLFIEFWNLKIDFKNLAIVQIPREENKEADRLSKMAINSKSSLFFL